MPAVSRQIERADARLFEDFRLAGAELGRIRELQVVNTAFDSIMGTDITYVSTPITSGSRLYRVMDQAGVKTPDELKADKAFFFENVIKHNIDNADDVAKALLKAKGGTIIAPASFEAKQLGWGQDEYMGLWLDVIEKKATRIALIDGWEYSNGGAEEYLQAQLMQAGFRDRNNISVIDERGATIRLPVAIRLMGRALEDLHGRGFQPKAIAQVLERSINIWTIVSSIQDYGVPSTNDLKYIPRSETGTYHLHVSTDYLESYLCERQQNGEMYDALRAVRHIREEIHPMLVAESAAMPQPGLIRVEGRGELAEQKAGVHTEEKKPEASVSASPAPVVRPS